MCPLIGIRTPYDYTIIFDFRLCLFQTMQHDDDAACCRNDVDYDWGTDGDRVRLFFTLILHTTVFMGLLDSRKTTKRKKFNFKDCKHSLIRND